MQVLQKINHNPTTLTSTLRTLISEFSVYERKKFYCILHWLPHVQVRSKAFTLLNKKSQTRSRLCDCDSYQKVHSVSFLIIFGEFSHDGKLQFLIGTTSMMFKSRVLTEYSVTVRAPVKANYLQLFWWQLCCSYVPPN